MIKPSTLSVVIRNKEQVLFSGQAKAITSVNDKGPFDILTQHENFITLIKDMVVVHVDSEEKKQFEIKSGIIRVNDDKVFAYINKY